MTILISTGNLTKDAEVKTTDNGKKYVFFQIAENIYKRDTNGKVVKDENGNSVTLQTMYYSVFVNDKTGGLTAASLTKGQAVKVVGKARIDVVKNTEGYNENIIKSINAINIDTDPFNKFSESDDMVDLEAPTS